MDLARRTFLLLALPRQGCVSVFTTSSAQTCTADELVLLFNIVLNGGSLARFFDQVEGFFFCWQMTDFWIFAWYFCLVPQVWSNIKVILNRSDTS